ncbi:MAG: SDR family oxidoreductase [Gemmatimonadota bacterium]|jgi:NAD(P)-dependent dehydrogenase (short-subunit alcohol dehydrogenase family)
MIQQRQEVVVITGASAGVGRATVRRFARDRASIGLIARGRERLEAAAREVESAGGRALVLPTDVADPDALEAAAARVEEELGPIDIWVNNAMTSVLAPAHEVAPDEYRRVTEVNYLGFVFGTLSALRRMRPRNRGVIIQVGSALAYRGIPLQAAYCGSKHAIQGFTESLRAELIHDGSDVHVGIVHMPALNTPQFQWVRSRMEHEPQPVPPIFQPEVAADAIHWAAHNRRAILYVGYPTVETVLGNRVSSRLLDYYLARTGFDSQQTDEPAEPNRPDNLFDSVPGDFAAHGRFDDRARNHSPQLWASKHRGWLALAGAAALAAAIAVRD